MFSKEREAQKLGKCEQISSELLAEAVPASLLTPKGLISTTFELFSPSSDLINYGEQQIPRSIQTHGFHGQARLFCAALLGAQRRLGAVPRAVPRPGCQPCQDASSIQSQERSLTREEMLQNAPLKHPESLTRAIKSQVESSSCLVKKKKKIPIKIVIASKLQDSSVCPYPVVGQLQEPGLPVCHNNCFCLSYLVQSKQAKFIARAAARSPRRFPQSLPSISPAPLPIPPQQPLLLPDPLPAPLREGSGQPFAPQNELLKVSPSFPIAQSAAPSLCHPAVPWRKACTFSSAGSPGAPRHPRAGRCP
ncbi:uncharacterized protein [Ciconia boyciana]|uniref:uncharacterized protein isoform X1 n=1 Tax=Ciconia boyciana TaxID=52775 RepID=UPI003BA24164